MTLDTHHIKREVIIADINDDALLGMDILKGKGGNPADIILSQGKIILNDTEIKCEHYSDSHIRKIKAADHYINQGYTEQIIDVLVDRSEYESSNSDKSAIIEPTLKF